MRKIDHLWADNSLYSWRTSENAYLLDTVRKVVGAENQRYLCEATTGLEIVLLSRFTDPQSLNLRPIETFRTVSLGIPVNRDISPILGLFLLPPSPQIQRRTCALYRMYSSPNFRSR
jgi:hypothetical protein